MRLLYSVLSPFPESIKKWVISHKLASLILTPVVFSLALVLVFGLVDPFLSPEFSVTTNKLAWQSNKPTSKISFSCSKIEKVVLNNKELTKEELNKLCSPSGLTVHLKGGKNVFHFVGVNRKFGRIKKDITISFDEKKYKERLAQQKQAELKRKEEEKKQEEERKMQEKQRIVAWKKKYIALKKTRINKALDTSEQMIKTFANAKVLPYTLRNLALSYKAYFRDTCPINFDRELGKPPAVVAEEVKTLDSAYRNFCMYNEFLAARVVHYLETDSTAKQYKDLDQIKYYGGLIENNKIAVIASLVVIDKKLEKY